MAKRERFELRLTDGHMTAMRRTAQARGPLNQRVCSCGIGQGYAGFGLGSSRQRSLLPPVSTACRKRSARPHHSTGPLCVGRTSLAKLFLTCVPEPPPTALDQAKRKARLRYDKFLLSVAQNMASDSRANLAELVDRG